MVVCLGGLPGVPSPVTATHTNLCQDPSSGQHPHPVVDTLLHQMREVKTYDCPDPENRYQKLISCQLCGQVPVAKIDSRYA